MARKYAELGARGKPAKVALTGTIRKLVVLATALLKRDRLWTPRPRLKADLGRGSAIIGGSGVVGKRRQRRIRGTVNAAKHPSGAG